MLVNFFKNQNAGAKQTPKKPKLLFYKRLDRFHYRMGRKLLLNKLGFKKYAIQTFITKKIYNLIKKPFLFMLKHTNLTTVLIICNLFYTQTDSHHYITQCGVLINNRRIFDSNTIINVNDIFSISNTLLYFKFFKKKKNNLLVNFKKIKFYKHRVKSKIINQNGG